MKKLERYIAKGGEKLRYGYTTGSCAAGASKAAVMKLLGLNIDKYIEIETPKGIELTLEVETLEWNETEAIASVKKDAGDDPDQTNGIEIYSKVSRREDNYINIYGGEGIGTIEVEGFWGKIGDSAINKVPREMIEKEIRKHSDGGYDIEIFAPKGKELSKKTFNENIGIKGGISIIGTTGIVEPMSDDAFKKSIYAEIEYIYIKGYREITMYLGNYGERIVKELYHDSKKVKISNYIGESIEYAKYLGFDKIRLVGHIGKLSKLSIGAFNTHSKFCDIRIESFIYYLAVSNIETSKYIIEKIKNHRTTEEVVETLIEEDRKDIFKLMKTGCIDRIKRHIKDEEIEIEVTIYSMKYGVL